MPYAYVQDVAAGWESYETIASAIGDELPAGLIVRAAGPTGAGFRIIEVWESEEAWERFRTERLRPATRNLPGDASTRDPSFESLDVRHLVAR